MNSSLSDSGFWLDNSRGLHVCDEIFIRQHKPFQLPDTNIKSIKDQVVQEGYIELPPPQWNLPIGDMAAKIGDLARSGLPTPAAFVYDEFWILYLRLHQFISEVLGGDYLRLPDFWAWHVDPKMTQSGWKPHRDKGRQTLNKDGSPNAITIWIPLSDSTTLNGCMYILPADRDPTYNTPEENRWQINFPDIRALPARAGTIFCWNQAVLHWGSKSSPRATTPRVSVAFEFQSASVPPYNMPVSKPGEIPNFESRLKLIAKQVLQYRHMYPLDPAIESWAKSIIGERSAPSLSATPT
jgi:hypothetical protein